MLVFLAIFYVNIYNLKYNMNGPTSTGLLFL